MKQVLNGDVGRDALFGKMWNKEDVYRQTLKDTSTFLHIIQTKGSHECATIIESIATETYYNTFHMVHPYITIHSVE